MSQKFSLGKLVITPGAKEALEESDEDAMFFITRHATGDWGVVREEDQRRNDEAVREGERILSAYVLLSDVRIWVITEWDRSVTTILLPEDY